MVSGQDRAAFARDGALLVPGAFGPEWIELLRAAAELAMSSPSAQAEDFASSDGRYFSDIGLASRFEPFERFVLESPVAALAGRLMGASRVALFFDQLFVKEPGTTKASPWHQDQPYWPLMGDRLCTVWLALDPVPPDAALQCVRGSHVWPEFCPRRFDTEGPYLGTGLPELPPIDGRTDLRIESFPMQPGDCLVFHARLVHRSPANLGPNRRRALATRWAGDGTRFRAVPGEEVIAGQRDTIPVGALVDDWIWMAS